MKRMVWSCVLAASALSTTLIAQNPPQYWATDGCFYQSNGRGGYESELCRKLVAPHTFDYWNRREWLLRIEDNPANPYQDITFLQGQMVGCGARVGRPRPGHAEAVRAGIWAYRDPQGVWTNVPVAGDTPAGRMARDIGGLINGHSQNRSIGILLGGIPIIR